MQDLVNSVHGNCWTCTTGGTCTTGCRTDSASLPQGTFVHKGLGIFLVSQALQTVVHVEGLLYRLSCLLQTNLTIGGTSHERHC